MICIVCFPLKNIFCSLNNFLVLSWRPNLWIINVVGCICYLYFWRTTIASYAMIVWLHEIWKFISYSLLIRMKIFHFDPSFSNFFFNKSQRKVGHYPIRWVDLNSTLFFFFFRIRRIRRQPFFGWVKFIGSIFCEPQHKQPHKDLQFNKLTSTTRGSGLSHVGGCCSRAFKR